MQTFTYMKHRILIEAWKKEKDTGTATAHRKADARTV